MPINTQRLRQTARIHTDIVDFGGTPKNDRIRELSALAQVAAAELDELRARVVELEAQHESDQIGAGMLYGNINNLRLKVASLETQLADLQRLNDENVAIGLRYMKAADLAAAVAVPVLIGESLIVGA